MSKARKDLVIALLGSSTFMMVGSVSNTEVLESAFSQQDSSSSKKFTNKPLFLPIEQGKSLSASTVGPQEPFRQPVVSSFLFKTNNKIRTTFFISNLLKYRNYKITFELYKVNRSFEARLAAQLNQVQDIKTQRITTINEEPLFLDLYRFKEETISQSGEAAFFFDRLSPDTEYVARIVLPNNTEFEQTYFPFDTKKVHEFKIENLESSATKAWFVLDPLGIRNFLNTKNQFDLAIGIRKYTANSEKYPWILRNFSFKEEDPKVVVENLEIGTEYEVAIFSQKEHFRNLISTIVRFKTKTSQEIKHAPIVRVSRNEPKNLEITVENLIWRTHFSKKLKKEDLVSLGTQSFVPETSIDDFLKPRIFEIRAYNFLQNITPTRLAVEAKNFGLREDLEKDALIVDEKNSLPSGVVSQRKVVQPGQSVVNFSLDNFPENADVIFEVYEVFESRKWGEIFVPFASKYQKNFAKSLENTPFEDLQNVEVEVEDVAFRARTANQLHSEIKLLTQESIQIFYRNYSPASGNYTLRYRSAIEDEYKKVKGYLLTNGLVANIAGLEPNTEHILELLENDRVVDIQRFFTQDVVSRVQNQETIEQTQANLVFEGLKQYEGLKFKAQLLNSSFETIQIQDVVISKNFSLSFENLLPGNKYFVRLYNNDFEQQSLVHESAFTTQRSYALQFVYEGSDILFFAPHEEDVINQTSETQYLATPIVFEYRVKGSNEEFFNHFLPQPNPLEYVVPGVWVKLGYFDPNQTYEYKYSFMKGDKKIVVSTGEFSSISAYPPKLNLIPQPQEGDLRPEKVLVTLSTAIKNNRLYKVVYSPILDANFYKEKSFNQTIFSKVQSPNSLVVARPEILEKSFIFDSSKAVNNQDGTVTFSHELVLNKDVLPGFEYRFSVVSIPEVIPRVARQNLENSLDKFFALENLTAKSSLDVASLNYTPETILENAEFLIIPSKATNALEETKNSNTNFLVTSSNEQPLDFGLVAFNSDSLEQNKQYFVHALGFPILGVNSDLNNSFPVVDQFVLLEKESFFASKVGGLTLSAFRLPALRKELNYVFRIIGLKRNVPKEKILEELTLTKPLSTFFVTYNSERIYQADFSPALKTTDLLTTSNQKPLPNLSLNVNANAIPKIRVSRSVAELDLNIPAFYIGSDHSLEVRLFEHKNTPIALDKTGQEKVAKSERFINFETAKVVGRFNTKNFGSNYLLRINNLKPNTHYSVAIFDKKQPSLPIFVAHDIHTVDSEVKLNYTTAVVTFSDIEDKRLLVAPGSNQDVYFLISKNKNFAPSSEESVFRYHVGRIEDIFDTKIFAIAGLEPDTTYYYSLSVSNTNVLGKENFFINNNIKSFHTPRAPKLSIVNYLDTNNVPFTTIKVSNLHGLGSSYISKYGLENAPIRIELKARRRRQKNAPRLSRWFAEQHKVFSLGSNSNSLSFQLRNLQENTYDLLLLAANPLFANLQNKPGQKFWINLETSPYNNTGVPSAFNQFTNLVNELKKDTFFHSNKAELVKDFALLNLNGTFKERELLPRTQLNHLFIPNIYLVIHILMLV